MLEKCWVPRSPADSMERSPAPTIRSNTDCEKNTVLMRSSGISVPDLATSPSRLISRSVVSTKLVVVQSASCLAPHRRATTIRTRARMDNPSPTVPSTGRTTSPSTMAPTSASTGLNRAIQWGRRSSTSSSPALSSFVG